MESKIVNKFFVINMIESISFYDLDDCIKVFSDLDVNDESEVKKIIRYRILINYLIRPKKYKEIIKNSLEYYLTTESVDFTEMYDSAQPAFDLPNNPKDFFIWVWEEFFKNEDYLIDDLTNYIEINDREELIKILPYTDNI